MVRHIRKRQRWHRENSKFLAKWPWMLPPRPLVSDRYGPWRDFPPWIPSLGTDTRPLDWELALVSPCSPWRTC
eukprot:scaffold85395_cov90-Attheya_sp.AAC.1